MRKTNSGFTIVELLVVIAIIGFLASALAVAAIGLAARSKIEKTAACIRKLDAGCEAYHSKFQDYPANEPKLTAAEVKSGAVFPKTPIKSDVYLYDYLAKPLTIVEGFSSTGAKKRNLDPFIEVVDSERLGDPTSSFSVQILDAFNQPIWYELPGFTHGPNFPDRSNRFDITSFGADQTTSWDKLGTPPFDDITNWTYDRK